MGPFQTRPDEGRPKSLWAIVLGRERTDNYPKGAWAPVCPHGPANSGRKLETV